MMSAAPSRTSLLSIPPEIREEIYRSILHPDANRVYLKDEYTSYSYAAALKLFQVSRQIYIESRKTFRDLNIFVRIETPWPEAKEKVVLEGHVPVLVSEARAHRFPWHSLNVSIQAPLFPANWEMQSMVILLDDLDKFTKTWFYTDLSHPGLNNQLQLSLQLRNPYCPSWEKQQLSKALQRKLLLPFGEVKNLSQTLHDGEIKPYDSIVKELEAIQAEPYKSAEHCLREAIRLKLEGNAELSKGNYRNALKLYTESWKAMHVVIKGRNRYIYGESFFAREMYEEPFLGVSGQTQRLLLRVQLVANTCQAYLKLEDYEECRFWGKRSIDTIRDAMGIAYPQSIAPEDEAVLRFPAADQMGKIYYRTSTACKMMGEENEAKRLLRVAKVYLPNDPIIAKELGAVPHSGPARLG